MVDNVAITAGSGTTIAADDIGAGVLAQRVKPVWGPDGTGNDIDVATGKPLPVQLRSPTGVDLTGAAGTASAAVLSVQGIASGTPQPVSIATLPTLAAGTNLIGKVGIDQTTDGTTNAVHLTAGTNIAGKFGIDQTTDGTTNLVRIGAETTKVIGTVNLATAVGGALTATSNALDVNIKSGGNVNGTTADSASAPVAWSTEGKAQLGSLTETAPASDTASSGLNGRLQRIAQRVTTLISSVIATTLGVTATANGATASRVNAGGSTNATNLKASAGQVYSIDVFNTAAYTVFLKLYNKASSPTVGTDTPVVTIPIAAGGGYSKTFDMGRPYATGISYAITKLQADSDTTAVVAGDLTGQIMWI